MERCVSIAICFPGASSGTLVGGFEAVADMTIVVRPVFKKPHSFQRSYRHAAYVQVPISADSTEAFDLFCREPRQQ